MSAQSTEGPRHLSLARPLAIIDLETTGVDVKRSRAVEIGILRVEPNGRRSLATHRCNPGIRIPAGASAVHGIRTADVEGEPTFGDLAREIARFLAGCDIGGFNVAAFDLQILVREFHRVGAAFSCRGRCIADAMVVYHQRVPKSDGRRDLSAAVRMYCGRDHSEAHSAGADVLASFDVLDAQVGMYRDLGGTVDGIHAACRGDAIDLAGVFRSGSRGEAIFTRGKHKGKSLARVAASDPTYLDWMRRKSAGFSPDTLEYLDTIARPSPTPATKPSPKESGLPTSAQIAEWDAAGLQDGRRASRNPVEAGIRWIKSLPEPLQPVAWGIVVAAPLAVIVAILLQRLLR